MIAVHPVLLRLRRFRRFGRAFRAAVDRRLAARGDEGSLSLFYCVAALCIFVVIGLVADGGGALNAAARADDVAQEAARAGGQQLDAGKAIPGEAVEVDPSAAAHAARAYLDREGVDGTVTVADGGTTLEVHVDDTYPTSFSSLIGVASIHVSGHGTAHLQQGG